MRKFLVFVGVLATLLCVACAAMFAGLMWSTIELVKAVL